MIMVSDSVYTLNKEYNIVIIISSNQVIYAFVTNHCLWIYYVQIVKRFTLYLIEALYRAHSNENGM